METLGHDRQNLVFKRFFVVLLLFGTIRQTPKQSADNFHAQRKRPKSPGDQLQ